MYTRLRGHWAGKAASLMPGDNHGLSALAKVGRGQGIGLDCEGPRGTS